jgi:hypothetical protein
VDETGDQRLIRQTLFEGFLLQCIQILAGNADIDSFVFAKGGGRVAGVTLSLFG